MDRLLRTQAGIVSRAQLESVGVRPHDLERMLRRRELTRVLPGVYADHTGPLTWVQRSWVGVLFYAPAALTGDSALRSAIPTWRTADRQIHLAIDTTRRCAEVAGFRLHRTRSLAARTHPTAVPPRIRLEKATIDAALARPGELASIGVLADACQSQRVTAPRLLEEVRSRARVPRREWLEGVLADIATGTCSTLEHGYLVRVERAHGLPRAQRQVAGRARVGVPVRDVGYGALALDVELDGRLFHDTARQRDLDLDRDLDAAVDGRATVRLGWGQVFERPCHTAARVSALLIRAGWTGRPHRCGPDCGL